jgi:hypothetical protein
MGMWSIPIISYPMAAESTRLIQTILRLADEPLFAALMDRGQTLKMGMWSIPIISYPMAAESTRLIQTTLRLADEPLFAFPARKLKPHGPAPS